MSATATLPTLPDKHGHFGQFGGMFVPGDADGRAAGTRRRIREARKPIRPSRPNSTTCSTNYVGRPTPLYFAERWTEQLGGAKIYLKREDLLHTGAHKINNALGQILLAQRMGKKRIIAETGAGQHGVATATVCARFGMECVIYMGEVDMERQALNVARMKLPRRRSPRRHRRPGHAQGSGQRSDARLGDQRPHTRTTSSAPRSARIRSR